MADIEALMYSYPVQGQPGFTTLLASREELWPTAYDLQKSAAQEVSDRLPPIGSTEDVGEEGEEGPAQVDALAVPDVAVARHAVRVLCERFMLVYDRLFLYYSTGAGKTVISSSAVEPLVRNIATELVDSYLNPKRTNFKQIVVIVSSDAQKRDFMDKIIRTSTRSKYMRAAEIGATQPVGDRMATYASALSPTYVFHTKTSFIAQLYGSSSTQGDVDPEKPDLSFVNNSIVIMDEVHQLSREDTHHTHAARREEEDDPDSPVVMRRSAEEDFRYAQFKFVMHHALGCKWLLMSATPMKDSPNEIIKILNLTLPPDNQVPLDLDVLDREKLMPYLRGYVSYFRTRSTRVMNRGVMIPLNNELPSEVSRDLPPQESESPSRRNLGVEPSRNPAPTDFEVIFPVAMSPHQAEVYRRVITEKDSFNRNALRASNTVYEDGTSGHAAFLTRFVKNARGLDGMEPNENFRTYLRASRDNREKISPKNCVTIDICRTSRGVVFVYCRGLEDGLFNLAAMFDAEGFERYTPAGETPFVTREDGAHDMFIDKRPRYALVTGETKTVPGRLEGITALANLEENADGEYLKVILGSAAVKESFDIFNSITIIFESPEQTETAMIQAGGRIVRPGAQDALLNRFPYLPRIISQYRLASYLPGTNYEGIDVKTYLTSARKDRLIKVVERMIRDASIDCPMLHNLNYDERDDTIDDSPACLYGPCDYTCEVSTGDIPVLDSSSMNALYRGEKLLRLKMELGQIATSRAYIPLQDVDRIVDSHALAQRVVETMNITKEQVRDRFGRQCYVYHDKNGVFFSASPVLTGLLGDGSGMMSPISMSDYEHYITTTLVTSLDTLMGTSLLLPGLLENILTSAPEKVITESTEADLALMRRFSLYVRREVIPKSALLEHVRVRGEQRVHGLKGNNIYWVDYSGLLYTRGDLRIYEGDDGISSIFDKKTSGLPLHILTKPSPEETQHAATWNVPSAVLMRILHQRWRGYMRDLFAPFESRFQFYGVIRPLEPDVLRIARKGRDNAKTPGRALPSWSSDDLAEVLSYVIAGKTNSPVGKKKITELGSPGKVTEFLIHEFERKGMLLRL